MGSLRVLALGGLLAAVATPSFAQTIRIEERNVYGATITRERGVNVIRPLPVVDRVIINPEGKTPLHLSYSENRTYEYSRSVSHNYNYDSGQGNHAGGAVYGGGLIGNGPAVIRRAPGVDLVPRRPHRSKPHH
jgi:hypothetical protein